VNYWLERLGIAELFNQYPGQLSGGQRQRVAIARTLILQPDLLLMDEPFSSLEAATRQNLREQILGLWQEQGFTFVVVTHTIEEAAHLGQSILVLGNPPHRQPEIIDNPCFGRPELEDDPQYRALLRELRARLAESTARPEGA
jgi:NitT/TauT family transport system ATP-binding protein